MDDFSSNSAEYVVKKKPEGAYLGKRILMIAGYVVICAVYSIIMIKTFFPMIAILPLLMIGIVCPKTWCYVNISNKIAVVSGTFTFVELYGKKKKKQIMETKVKDMEIIAPMSEEYVSKTEDTSIKKTYDARSSAGSPDAYFAVYKNAAGEKECILFDMSTKLLGIMQYYNKNATVVKSDLSR